MSRKTIFIIILILFVLAGASLAVYNFVLKTGEEPSQREGELQGQTPLAAKPISQDKAFALAIGEDNLTIKYYLVRNSHVVSSDFEGSVIEPLTTNDLSGLVSVLWSPDRKKVIGVFQNQGVTKKWFYDHSTKQSSLLPADAKEIAWSPDSKKIVYQYTTADGQYNNISVADANGANWRSIFQTRLENLKIEWPAPAKIYALSAPSSQQEGIIFAIDAATGASTKILSGVWGLEAKWSPDGQKFIYSASDQKGKNLKLFIAASDGSQPKQLPVATLAEKCIWSGDNQTIFCAVPQKISSYETWPDDYINRKVIVSDDIYLIDTLTQKETKIAQSDDEQSFDAENLVLSPQGDYLFFINRTNELIYNIELNL
ncbi:MAG: hypothetical protein V1845_00020 [bacterium]